MSLIRFFLQLVYHHAQAQVAWFYAVRLSNLVLRIWYLGCLCWLFFWIKICHLCFLKVFFAVIVFFIKVFICFLYFEKNRLCNIKDRKRFARQPVPEEVLSAYPGFLHQLLLAFVFEARFGQKFFVVSSFCAFSGLKKTEWVWMFPYKCFLKKKALMKDTVFRRNCKPWCKNFFWYRPRQFLLLCWCDFRKR